VVRIFVFGCALMQDTDIYADTDTDTDLDTITVTGPIQTQK